jgi:DNA-binding transcriptional regulator YiaG
MDFKDKIRTARLKMMLSQTELAAALGVSYPSVQRWETGKCNPTFKARRAFRELCEKNNIDIEKL